MHHHKSWAVAPRYPGHRSVSNPGPLVTTVAAGARKAGAQTSVCPWVTDEPFSPQPLGEVRGRTVPRPQASSCLHKVLAPKNLRPAPALGSPFPPLLPQASLRSPSHRTQPMAAHSLASPPAAAATLQPGRQLQRRPRKPPCQSPVWNQGAAGTALRPLCPRAACWGPGPVTWQWPHL